MVFHSLTKEHILSIVDLMLNEVRKELSEKKIALEATDAAKEFLAEKGYDPNSAPGRYAGSSRTR